MSKPVRVDQKGRLKIPANLIAPITTMGTGFFITSEDCNCARIYPLTVWKDIENRMIRLSVHSRDKQKLLLRVKYFGQAVNMDEQGRVLIPALLRKAAQIEGEVDVLDYQTYLEVWNHARFLKNLGLFADSDQSDFFIHKLAS